MYADSNGTLFIIPLIAADEFAIGLDSRLLPREWEYPPLNWTYTVVTVVSDSVFLKGISVKDNIVRDNFL